MLLDKSLKTFIEKYDQEMFEYFTRYSNRTVSMLNSFNSINLEESVKRFTEYMDELSAYYSSDTENKHDIRKVLENTSGFISEHAVVEGSYLNRDIPSYFNTFFECIESLIKSRDIQHNKLMESGETELSGKVVEFYDEFTEKMVDMVNETTDRFKIVSGYNTDQRLFNGFKNKTIEDNFIL